MAVNDAVSATVRSVGVPSLMIFCLGVRHEPHDLIPRFLQLPGGFALVVLTPRISALIKPWLYHISH